MCVKRLGAILLLLATKSAPAQTAMQSVFDPNDPSTTRAVISRAERERLGLRSHDWNGVVEPAVATVIFGMKDVPAEPVERFKFQQRIRFEGAAYVQVHLRYQANNPDDSRSSKSAIASLQHRVLSCLSADEFQVVQKFELNAGILGFVNSKAIQKLRGSPDVIGVCLDDAPFPDLLPILCVEDLPTANPDASANGQVRLIPKVDFAVTRALDLHDRVYVLVALESPGKPMPRLTEEPSQSANALRARQLAVRELQTRVLGTLTADDMWVSVMFKIGPLVGGYVTLDGVRKLASHREVKSILLNEKLGLMH